MAARDQPRPGWTIVLRRQAARVVEGRPEGGYTGACQLWTAPVILEALIPGRIQSHVSTAEVPQGPVVKAETAVSNGSGVVGQARSIPDGG